MLTIASAGSEHLGPTLMRACQELHGVPECKEFAFLVVVDLCLFPDHQVNESNQIKIMF